MPNDSHRWLGHPKFWLAVLALYWLALFVATHLPPNFPAMPRPGVDKAVHAATFALLAGLFAVAWQRSTGRLNARHLAAAWMVLALYAVVDELTQIPVGRVAAVGDWVADVVGAAVGLLLFMVWQRRVFPD